MSSLQKVGATAVVCLFTIASAVPVDAQGRRRSGSSVSSGASAAPRSAQGGGQSAGPRGPQGGGQATAPRAAQAGGRSGAPRGGSQGGGQSAGPRPPQGGGRGGGQPGYGPGYRPGTGPNYGYRGRAPYYGYRGHYPYYGYRGYYPWYGYRYNPGFYWGVGAYFGPYYYSPWFYSAYWDYPAYYYAYDSGYGSASGGASLKVNVEPKTAEVYVDGYLAGIVDQFDGTFQSLSLDPGEHEITIYQEGFRSMRQRLYLNAGSTYRVKGVMERLAPGEPNEPRPLRPADPPRGDVYAQPPSQYPQSQNPEPQYLPPARTAPPSPAPESYPAPGDGRYGQVAIRVQPADAEVLIDGEAWRAPSGAERLLVSLSPGTHRVEIRREGYDSFVTAIEVRRGETTPLNVSLARF
jgi:hypothetical protein